MPNPELTSAVVFEMMYRSLHLSTHASLYPMNEMFPETPRSLAHIFLACSELLGRSILILLARPATHFSQRLSRIHADYIRSE